MSDTGAIIHVFNVLDSPLCVSVSDGQKVYERIVPFLAESRKVTLFFDQIELMTPTFLNNAVGQLYGEFSETKIRELLSVQEMSKDDMVLLKLVVDNAKAYFKKRQFSVRTCGKIRKTKEEEQLEGVK